MKKIDILLLIVVCAIISCKNEEIAKPTAAAINVINIGTDAIKVNPTGVTKPWSSRTEMINFGTSKIYHVPTGNTDVVIAKSTDTTKILFDGSLKLESTIYSLYVLGSSDNNDAVFVEETAFPFVKTDMIIPSAADSVVNVRFVNFSVGSPALKIKIATITTNEVDNLPYKGIGGWKAYSARLATTSYSFQIRRADTDALVTTFNFSATSANRFKNVALVIRGVFGTTGATGFGVSTVNYF